MLTLSNSAGPTLVDTIPPPEITDITTGEPIAHRTQASQTMLDTPIQRTHEPVGRRTRSKINPKELAQQVDISPQKVSQRQFPRLFILNWAMPVMDTVTGETLEHRQLRRHPKYKKTCNQLYSNELGRLCQDIVKGSKGPKQQCVEGTDTFRINQHKDIPHDLCNEVTYTKVVCKYRSHKEYPNQNQITIGGNRICYPGDVSASTLFRST